MLTPVFIRIFLGRSRRGAAARTFPAVRVAPGAAPVARTWRVAGRRSALVVVLAAAGVQAVGSGPALAASGRAAASASAPVSNAFAMGGGVGGSVDQRTGTFSASFPLVTLNGRSGVGASLSLGYDQSLASQGAAGNRFGLGAGWSIGLPWVNTAGGIHVFPAAGGSYAYDAHSPTGLSQYPLQDLTFAQVSGVVAPRRVASPGSCQPTARLAGAQSYAWTLTYRDGAVDRFDASGNLIERADRFGNRVDITWQQAGSHWQPTSVVDNYGQATCFDYGAVGGVKITSPPRAPDGVQATVFLRIDQDRLAGIIDPAGQETVLSYKPAGGPTSGLLDSVQSPTGAVTVVDYSVLAHAPGVVVKSVRVTDASGADVLAERDFSIDPPGNQQHNYTGYPKYKPTAGSDTLFESGDPNYRYSTTLSDGRSTVESTYNSLHLLVAQQVTVLQGLVMVPSQQQQYGYPQLPSPFSPDHLPPNYAKPTSVAINYGNPNAGRTVTTSSSYDDYGELKSSTNAAGKTTTTQFDPRYGLPTKQTVTGADGTTSITNNDLTADGKSIHTTTTLVGTSAQNATARTVTTYSYSDAGELTGKSLTWAPGAKPSGPSGEPDQLDQTRTSTVDVAAHTRTDMVTAAAGTASAASTKTVSDLVTGHVLSQTDPAGRITSYSYDPAGRTTAVTAPGNLTTKTDFTPLTSTTTSPSGHVTVTTTDVVGRTIKVTDNVSGQKFVADPGARTIAATSYSVDGSTVTSTGPTGATTTTALDPLGRPIKVLKPDRVTQTTCYDDVANTQSTAIIPAGGNPGGANCKPADAAAVTVEGFDDLNRPISSATTYSDPTKRAPTSQAYDGLGRVTSLTANDVTARPSYAGAGGLQTAASLTPTNQAAFPGAPVTAATQNALTAASTLKTLSQGAASSTGAAYSYDPAGRASTVVGPGGKTTYTYTVDGKLDTVTSPSGALTTHHYDPATGRLTETEVSPSGGGATQKTAYHYDPATGLVTSVSDPDQPGDTITYQHDADGHTTAVRYPDGTATTATYNDKGQLATSTDITGALTTYTDNAAGELTAATQTRGTATLGSVTYGYDSLDRVHTITRGNGVKTAITFSDANQVASETTTAADGTPLRTSSYSSDAHGNLIQRTDTTSAPGRANPGRGRPRRKATAPTTSTTTYSYDAYNRLTGSATYPGAAATGTPTTKTTYTLDVSGNVVGKTTTANGTTTTTTNTIAPGDQLTTQTVNGSQTEQRFNPDGDVTRDLKGNTYTYNPSDHPTSVTMPNGATIAYTYWPDHTLRTTTTTTTHGAAQTTTLHYDAAGAISNDTYTGGALARGHRETANSRALARGHRRASNHGARARGHRGASNRGVRARGHRGTANSGVTASYLAALNREDRTLLAGSGSAGSAVRATGPGTGYYITDRHGSVSAMVDAGGQLTNTYSYSDYGQLTAGSPPAGRPTATNDAAVNPFTYDGAYTNPDTGNQDLPARTYDPSQGRYLAADSADLLNRYQAFNTNPVNMVDPTGQSAISDLFWHVLGAVAFVAGAIATGGAAIAAEAAITAAVVAGEEVTAAIASAVLYGIATAANIGAVATSATLIADDAEGLQGHHFLTNDQRNQLSTATLALGGIAAGAGLGGGAAAGADAATVADDAAQTEAAQTRVGPEDVRRNAIVEGEEPDVTFSATNKRNAIVPGEEPSLDLSPPRFVTQNGSEESFPELPPAPEGSATIYGEGGEARFLTDYPEQTGAFLPETGRPGRWWNKLYLKSLPKVFGQQAGEDLGSPDLRSPHADEEYAPYPDWPSAQTPASRSPSTGAQADTGTLGTSNPLAEAGATSITKTLQSNSFVTIGGRRYEVINLT